MILQAFTSRKAFTLLAAAMVLHNAEEVLTMPRFPQQGTFQFFTLPGYNQFLVAVLLLTLAIGIAYVSAMQSDNKKLYLFVSTAFAVSMLFNVFIPHLAVAAYTLHYTPGLITAIVLNLPFSLILIFKNGPAFEGRKQMLRFLAGGFAAGYVLFALTLVLAMVLIK